MEVIGNLQKAHQIWARISRVLGREGADERTSGRFYLAIVQAILVFVLETWVTTPRIGRILGRFHHWVEQRITGKQPRR